MKATAPVGIGSVITDPHHTLAVTANGRRRRDSPEAISEEDRWHIGSNAKAMIAVLYARLVGLGIFTWDETVDQLFPTLPIHPSLRFTTAEDLMSHRSGVADRGLLSAWALIKSHLDDRPLPQQRLALAAKALAAGTGEAEAKFSYANANYVIVASAMEERTGASFEDLIEQHLFRPLGMTSAGFGAPEGNHPWGHRRGLVTLGRLRAFPPSPAADNPSFLRPAGGIHLCLEDYAKFLRIFLNQGGGFIAPQSLEKLTAPAGTSPPYALGWIVENSACAGRRVLSHEGSNTMWYATVVVSPGRGLAAAAVSNEGSARAAKATRQLVRKLLADRC